MANDREVLREIWEGKLPVCFQIHPEEVYALQAPDPFYLMVPRLSYFPLVTDKVRKHFSRHIQPERRDAEMWLDFNGQPLKWHYPIGLLFDLQGNDISLPWNITVHFDKFPEAEILHCPSREAVESHFMSTVKEADALKHRGQVAGSMQKKEHNQLWMGLQNDKFDQFWSVNRRLMEVGSTGGGGGGSATVGGGAIDEGSSHRPCFRFIPFRCYMPSLDVPYRQRPVRPCTDDGRSRTLGELLEEVFPEEKGQATQTVRVVTHGVEPPKEVPLQWLSEHLSYPDNFLHLVCHYISEKTSSTTALNIGSASRNDNH
ncbi:autophagy protein 5 [Ischnura elegans]|uniref:autophagy protein 5 n=1 Tax=Ischnura elegans TaxID=197161 RepID=UPI001ED8B08B|nr:autophagy protein 5 [Ischnura elegans]